MAPQNRWLTVLFLVSLTLMVGATAASAQTGLQNSPQAFTFTFNNCNGQQITGVTTSNNSVVLLDTSSTAVYVATAVTVSLTLAGQPAVTLGPFPFAAGHGQATGLQGSLITCTSEPAAIPGGTETLTVTMFSTPR